MTIGIGDVEHSGDPFGRGGDRCVVLSAGEYVCEATGSLQTNAYTVRWEKCHNGVFACCAASQTISGSVPSSSRLSAPVQNPQLAVGSVTWLIRDRQCMTQSASDRGESGFRSQLILSKRAGELLEQYCLLLIVDVVAHQLRTRRSDLLQVELRHCAQNISGDTDVAVLDLRFQQI